MAQIEEGGFQGNTTVNNTQKFLHLCLILLRQITNNQLQPEKKIDVCDTQLKIKKKRDSAAKGCCERGDAVSRSHQQPTKKGTATHIQNNNNNMYFSGTEQEEGAGKEGGRNWKRLRSTVMQHYKKSQTRRTKRQVVKPPCMPTCSLFLSECSGGPMCS